MRHYLAAIAVVLALSACSFSRDDPSPAIRMVQTPVEAPESSRRSCKDLLSPLPSEGGLTEKEVTDKWGNDRTALTICDGRRAGAIGAIDRHNAAAERQNAETGDRNEP